MLCRNPPSFETKISFCTSHRGETVKQCSVHISSTSLPKAGLFRWHHSKEQWAEWVFYQAERPLNRHLLWVLIKIIYLNWMRALEFHLVNETLSWSQLCGVLPHFKSLHLDSEQKWSKWRFRMIPVMAVVNQCILCACMCG